mgnify:CR=1 FL=1
MSELPLPPLAVLLIGLGGLSFLAVLLAIPRMMPFFLKYALSRPNARSSHRTPTPQGGGTPVVLAVLGLTGLALGFGLVRLETGFHTYYVLLLAAAFAVALVGAADDMRPLPALTRLGMQAILTGLIVFGAPEDWRLAPMLPVEIERILVVVAGVWFVNLTNFMDGIDWIVVVEFVPLSVVLALLSALGVISGIAGVVAATLAGALTAFALFNRHPARLFLGDVGSLAIGLIAASLLFELATRVSVAAALLLPLYFLFDATETLLLGLAKGENVLAAHRRHAYQNAVDGGMPAPEVTRKVLLLNLGLAVLALGAVVADSPFIDIVLLIVGLNATIQLSRHFRARR